MWSTFSSPRPVCHVITAPEDRVYQCLICMLMFQIASFLDIMLWKFLFCSSQTYVPYHNPFNLLLIICEEGVLIILLFCNFSLSPWFIAWKKILVTLFSHIVTFFLVWLLISQAYKTMNKSIKAFYSTEFSKKIRSVMYSKHIKKSHKLSNIKYLYWLLYRYSR